MAAFSRSAAGARRNFWSRVGIPTCRAHRASKIENRRLTTVTSENFVVAVAGSLFLLLFLLLSGGAFSPAYKREYTAVPLRPGAELCMYATCIHGSLARSRQDKRDPYILAWLGIDWPEVAEVRRCAGVGGTARLVVVRSGAFSSRTARDWSVPGADWPTRLSNGIERSGVHADARYTHSGRLFSALFHPSSPISLLSRWSLSSSRPPAPRPGIYPFLCLSIPQSHLLRLSLARSSVRKQSLSGVAQRERSLGRDMNSRSSFYIPRSPALHFACSSPLSTSPICDYRMCRPHSYLIGPTLSSSHSLFLTLFPPVYAHDHAVRRRRPLFFSSFFFSSSSSSSWSPSSSSSSSM